MNLRCRMPPVFAGVFIGITILLAFHPTGSSESVSLTLHQTIDGCRVASTAFAPSPSAETFSLSGYVRTDV